MQATTSDKDEASHRIDFRDVLCPGKMVECRICQDEDEDRNMETPCSCCGSLKYAHRKCVQRWCNEKGDTICEICHQPFKPDYTAPPPLFHFGRIPMNFRGNWEVYRRETPNGPRLIAMVSTDRNFAEPRLPEDSASMTRSILHCRSIAAIFMMLLILRHTLPVLVAETIDEFSFSTLTLLVLRIAGIVLPIYIIIKILNLTSVQRHQYQQVVPAPAPALSPSSSFSSISDEETEDSTQLHVASFTAS